MQLHRRLKKLSSRGVSHHFLLPVLAILMVAGIGGYIMQRNSSAAVYTIPDSAVVFNNPLGTDLEKRAVVDKIAEGIDNAPAGSTIRLAVHSFTLSDFADKMIAAKARGVNVYMVTDNHLYDGSANQAANTAQMERLKVALGTTVTTGTGSYIKICKDACVGTNIMHAKLFLFSQTGDSKLVTMIGSSNLTTTQINAWNNLYAIVGNQTLYDKMKWYFDSLAKEPNNGTISSSMTSGKNMILTYPRSYSSTSDDPYYSHLSKVKCTGASTGYGIGGKTTIDVAMYQWTTTRPAVAKKLSDLANSGCIVRVIISKSNYSKAPLVTLTSNSKIKVVDMDTNIVNGKPGVFSHHKYMIINGYYDGSGSAKVVFTGSHNMSSSAIKYNEELIIRVKDAVVYDKFLENYNFMWPQGRAVTAAEAAAM